MNKDVEKNKPKINFFEKYLTIWVIICMIIGILISEFIPQFPELLNKLTFFNVSIPIAILIWLMIYPMMMKVDFNSVKNAGKNPKGLFLTWVVNWLIKPFTMFIISYFFFFIVFSNILPPESQTAYLQGAILLGAAPCTAMVFVWSHLTKGNPSYTVVQVATNDLIILIAFVPIVTILLGLTGIATGVGLLDLMGTLILSVVLFVVIPLILGVLTRYFMVKKKGKEYFEDEFIPKFNNTTIVGLLLTLVFIFSIQGQQILHNPLDILLIAVPLILQTLLIFTIAYVGARLLKLPHNIASPAAMIGASNFFELSVAVAIAVFGADSPVVLATIVGVLVEVPVMLALVKLSNSTSGWFKEGDSKKDIKEFIEEADRRLDEVYNQYQNKK